MPGNSKPHEHCADCLAYVNCVTCCECGDALVPFHPDIERMTIEASFDAG